jgi:hypothetical protein
MVIGAGTPEQIAELKTPTGKFLRRLLSKNVGPALSRPGAA